MLPSSSSKAGINVYTASLPVLTMHMRLYAHILACMHLFLFVLVTDADRVVLV